MNKKYVIVLDTETCNSFVDEETGKLNLDFSLVYDIGWQVVDLKGNVYRRRSFIIREVFYDYADIMQSAYYAEKIPLYEEDIENGLRIVTNFFTMRKTLIDDMKEFNCTIVSAHNARFDHHALNNTYRYLTKSKYRHFFPYNTEIWDTLKMARQTYAKEKGYNSWCRSNGYMTNHKTPQVRLTAEIIYRYITGNNDFIESHTGLEDVEIETEILAFILKKHKKLNRALW